MSHRVSCFGEYSETGSRDQSAARRRAGLAHVRTLAQSPRHARIVRQSLSQMANLALDNPLARWLLEKTFGIAQGRKLPKVSRRTFLRWAAREKLNRLNRGSGRKVLYFVDQYVNWHNPLLGRALVEVMRHQRVEVYVPTNQTPSYMSMIASGDVARARKLIKPNIRLLAEAVRNGYDIVTTEPSAALCLQQEYRNLISDEDTELISKHVFEVCSYLWQMHTRNELELTSVQSLFRWLSRALSFTGARCQPPCVEFAQVDSWSASSICGHWL